MSEAEDRAELVRILAREHGHLGREGWEGCSADNRRADAILAAGFRLLARHDHIPAYPCPPSCPAHQLTNAGRVHHPTERESPDATR